LVLGAVEVAGAEGISFRVDGEHPGCVDFGLREWGNELEGGSIGGCLVGGGVEDRIGGGD